MNREDQHLSGQRGSVVKRFLGILLAILICASFPSRDGLGVVSPDFNSTLSPDSNASGPQEPAQIYLPVLFNLQNARFPQFNVPHFDGEILYEETAIFWFGQVTPTTNYADVRIGYNDDMLWVRVSIIDRRLWYDPQPSANDLTQWDAVSLYLDVGGNSSDLGSGNVFRMDAQLNWWEPRQGFQAAYKGSGSGWVADPLSFTTQTRWYGFPQPNDDKDDRGWWVIYAIPFQSLGLPGSPSQGDHWHLGVQVHDRDDSAGTLIPDQVWPQAMDSELPGTWGQINFGLPSYDPPNATGTQTISIRNGLNGITVLDGVVGGNTNCGAGIEFWSAWGNHSYLNVRDVNIQNQGNTDDWPCFAKYYVSFPLDSLPPGKVIVSATLTMHQSGNSTGFDYDPPKALNSLIQVFLVGEDWDPATLSWNNGPLPLENVSQAWVGSITMADLGIARVWDVSRVVVRAYDMQEPLRLVLNSADYYGPHGKYFYSSTSDDYGGADRPQLDIVLADP